MTEKLNMNNWKIGDTVKLSAKGNEKYSAFQPKDEIGTITNKNSLTPEFANPEFVTVDFVDTRYTFHHTELVRANKFAVGDYVKVKQLLTYIDNGFRKSIFNSIGQISKFNSWTNLYEIIIDDIPDMVYAVAETKLEYFSIVQQQVEKKPVAWMISETNAMGTKNTFIDAKDNLKVTVTPIYK